MSEDSRVEQLVLDWDVFLRRHPAFQIHSIDLKCILEHPSWPWATPFHGPERAPCPTCMEKGEPWNCPSQPGMLPFTVLRTAVIVPPRRLTAPLAKDLGRGRRLHPERNVLVKR